MRLFYVKPGVGKPYPDSFESYHQTYRKQNPKDSRLKQSAYSLAFAQRSWNETERESEFQRLDHYLVCHVHAGSFFPRAGGGRLELGLLCALLRFLPSPADKTATGSIRHRSSRIGNRQRMNRIVALHPNVAQCNRRCRAWNARLSGLRVTLVVQVGPETHAKRWHEAKLSSSASTWHAGVQ